MECIGKFPLRDHVPTPDEYDIPSNSEDEILQLIITDLEYAIEHLPTRSQWGTDNLGRISKGSAQGLLAKVYLFKQDYTNAAKYANDVVNGGEFSLESDYRNLFAPDNLYSVENMMPGHYIYINITGRNRNPYVEYQGLPTIDNATSMSIGSACILPSKYIVESYETGDPRQEASIFNKGDQIPGLKNSAGTPITNLDWKTSDDTRYEWNWGNKKLIWPYETWPNGDFFSQEMNYPFMRYAEILLIYAEAANEIGSSAEALSALEKVRFRARSNKTFSDAGTLPQITTTDKVELREKIWNERRIELAFEGHRWFDLVRYEKVVPNYTTNLLKAIGRTNFNYTKYSKFPIPLSRINQSDGILVQNNAWK